MANINKDGYVQQDVFLSLISSATSTTMLIDVHYVIPGVNKEDDLSLSAAIVGSNNTLNNVRGQAQKWEGAVVDGELGERKDTRPHQGVKKSPIYNDAMRTLEKYLALKDEGLKGNREG
ncbi:hypothetical protein LOAG_01211 [Loa loa]|uniref:Uncharacterized protein n=1 Tax=Loa loa TaxID=7209 RepID=A0A1S0U9X0_LOALO|nr:hypothetical protein LOAG_01211 [Loa loa]EFO27274.1 hypothetical protein LOAG_01211 [Loa loa]